VIFADSLAPLYGPLGGPRSHNIPVVRTQYQFKNKTLLLYSLFSVLTAVLAGKVGVSYFYQIRLKLTFWGGSNLYASYSLQKQRAPVLVNLVEHRLC